MAINWIKVYNRLFTIINTPGDTYYSGSQFLDLVREVDEDTPSYKQLIDSRNQQGKGTSRKDYYLDVISEHSEAERIGIYNAFIEKLEPIVPEAVHGLKVLLEIGVGGPVAVIPPEVWNSDRLTSYLEQMDASIVAQNYNHTLTLSYTCLEGFYKAFIRARIPAQVALNELIPMSVEIRNYIRHHLQNSGIPFPEQMVILIATMTNAVANSRNHFGDAHFADESDKWLAEFVRDNVNSLVRLLLKFI